MRLSQAKPCLSLILHMTVKSFHENGCIPPIKSSFLCLPTALSAEIRSSWSESDGKAARCGGSGASTACSFDCKVNLGMFP